VIVIDSGRRVGGGGRGLVQGPPAKNQKLKRLSITNDFVLSSARRPVRFPIHTMPRQRRRSSLAAEENLQSRLWRFFNPSGMCCEHLDRLDRDEGFNPRPMEGG
jgi:hypothetical protein